MPSNVIQRRAPRAAPGLELLAVEDRPVARRTPVRTSASDLGRAPRSTRRRRRRGRCRSRRSSSSAAVARHVPDRSTAPQATDGDPQPPGGRPERALDVVRANARTMLRPEGLAWTEVHPGGEGDGLADRSIRRCRTPNRRSTRPASTGLRHRRHRFVQRARPRRRPAAGSGRRGCDGPHRRHAPAARHPRRRRGRAPRGHHRRAHRLAGARQIASPAQPKGSAFTLAVIRGDPTSRGGASTARRPLSPTLTSPTYDDEFASSSSRTVTSPVDDFQYDEGTFPSYDGGRRTRPATTSRPVRRLRRRLTTTRPTSRAARRRGRSPATPRPSSSRSRPPVPGSTRRIRRRIPRTRRRRPTSPTTPETTATTSTTSKTTTTTTTTVPPAPAPAWKAPTTALGVVCTTDQVRLWADRQSVLAGIGVPSSCAAPTVVRHGRRSRRAPYRPRYADDPTTPPDPARWAPASPRRRGCSRSTVGDVARGDRQARQRDLVERGAGIGAFHLRWSPSAMVSFSAFSPHRIGLYVYFEAS